MPEHSRQRLFESTLYSEEEDKLTDLEVMRQMLMKAGIEFKEHKSDILNGCTVIDVERGYVSFHVMLSFGYYTGALIDVAAL